MREPVAFRTQLVLLVISLSVIAAVWYWLGRPVILSHAPIDPTAKLDCVSYAPFRDDQSPWNSDLVVSPEQIASDLVQLARISKCVRTYSVENGLDKVPELASRVGLKVILGVWLGRNRIKNSLLVDKAIALANNYRGVVTAMIVGSEVLLRGEMTAADLRQIIRSARARANIPVSYADVWEFWLRYREVSEDVDFVTIHILPYWEDFPVRAEDAGAHVDDIRKRMTLAFPGKEILIGEAGWPSRGRMRDGALPSRINQARFISAILDRAREEKYRVSMFEAYDEPWKRQFEGTVGAHWGLLDGQDRALKYPDGAAISDYPFWKRQMGCGLALGLAVFGAAWLALRHRPRQARLRAWLAVAACATMCGILVGLAAEKLLYESYGFDGWLLHGALLMSAVAAPLLSAAALMSGRALPTFLELIGPPKDRTQSFAATSLGCVLTLTTLAATEVALSLIFDPRWRDFPFASLTMIGAPFCAVALLNRRKSGTRPIAEAVFAGLFAIAALYILFNEGFRNWQSLWTSAAYCLLGVTLWQARGIVGVEMASATPAAADGALLDERKLALQPLEAG